MYPQYPHNLIFKLERLKAKKFSVMGVTDRDLSPLCSLADPVLCLPTTKDLFFGSYSTTMLFSAFYCRILSARTSGQTRS